MKSVHVISIAIAAACLLVGTLAVAGHNGAVSKDGGVAFAAGDGGKVTPDLAGDGGKAIELAADGGK